VGIEEYLTKLEGALIEDRLRAKLDLLLTSRSCFCTIDVHLVVACDRRRRASYGYTW
jgi:hypothetical protein